MTDTDRDWQSALQAALLTLIRERDRWHRDAAEAYGLGADDRGARCREVVTAYDQAETLLRGLPTRWPEIPIHDRELVMLTLCRYRDACAEEMHVCDDNGLPHAAARYRLTYDAACSMLSRLAIEQTGKAP